MSHNTADGTRVALPPLTQGPHRKRLGLISVVACLGGLLFGYDTGVTNGAEGPMAQDLGLSLLQLGVVISSLIFAAAVGALVWGRVSDTWGRRKTIILLAVLFSAIGVILLLSAEEPEPLRPTGASLRLVTDRALVAAIAADPATKADLARLKEFNGRASRTQLDRWWAAIEAGRADPVLPAERVPGDGMPPPRAWIDRNPAADARLKSARPRVEAIAEDLHMPTENLLTPDTLRRVAWEPPAESTAEAIGAALAAQGARPWQVEATADAIAAAFVRAAQTPPDSVEDDS